MISLNDHNMIKLVRLSSFDEQRDGINNVRSLRVGRGCVHGGSHFWMHNGLKGFSFMSIGKNNLTDHGTIEITGSCKDLLAQLLRNLGNRRLPVGGHLMRKSISIQNLNAQGCEMVCGRRFAAADSARQANFKDSDLLECNDQIKRLI